MFQDANGQSGQRKTNVTLCMKSAAIILTLRLFAENAEIVGGSRIRDLGTEREEIDGETKENKKSTELLKLEKSGDWQDARSQFAT